MKYVNKTMGIYTSDAKRAMELTREILEKEENKIFKSLALIHHN